MALQKVFRAEIEEGSGPGTAWDEEKRIAGQVRDFDLKNAMETFEKEGKISRKVGLKGDVTNGFGVGDADADGDGNVGGSGSGRGGEL